MKHVTFNHESNDSWGVDEVIVNSRGPVSFRMWDVNTGAPEKTHKETFRRIFGCSKQAPETAIDWDFLLDD
jgi:hypothetical protein